MEETGPLFRKIRESRNLSVKDVAGEIVTPQFLRKYEKGISDIRSQNLIQLLFQMNVTMTEFISELDDTLDKWLERTEKELDYAFNAGNSFLLKGFIQEQEEAYARSGEEKYDYMAMIGKFYYNYLFPSVYSVDFSRIKTYLRRIEQWGKFELFLLSYAVSIFEPEESFLYGRQLLKKKEKNVVNAQWKYDAVLHIILSLIRKSKIDDAEKLLELYFDGITADRDFKYIHHDLFAHFVSGTLLLKKGDPSGQKKCEEIIEVFGELLSYTEYANRLNAIYHLHLSEMPE